VSGTANDFAIMHFSTDPLPQRERVPMLRDFIGPMVARFDVEPVGDEPPHFAITARIVPDLAISSLAFSAIRGHRTRALAADGNDNCLLSCIHSPGNSVIHRGNEVTPPDGTGTLLSMSDPFICATVSGIARGMSVSVPRKLLTAMVPDLEDRFTRTLVPTRKRCGCSRSTSDRWSSMFCQPPSCAVSWSATCMISLRSRSAPRAMSPRSRAAVACARRASTPSRPTSAPRSASRA
jgi:hypothetical protein